MWTGPPKALGMPKPMSSMRTMSTLGAPAGAFTSKRVGGFASRASSTVDLGMSGSRIGRTVRSGSPGVAAVVGVPVERAAPGAGLEPHETAPKITAADRPQRQTHLFGLIVVEPPESSGVQLYVFFRCQMT